MSARKKKKKKRKGKENCPELWQLSDNFQNTGTCHPTLVIHVQLGKGVHPLILHHVRRQNAVFTPVICDASRENDLRERSRTGPLRSSSVQQLTTSPESWGGCLAVTSPTTETPPASCRARTPKRLALSSRERRERKRVLINENARVASFLVHDGHRNIPCR
jgi:hypothetical protein